MNIVLLVLAMSAFVVLVSLALVYSGSLMSYLLFGSKKGKRTAKSLAITPYKLNLKHTHQKVPISIDGRPYQEIVEDDAARISAMSSQSRIGLMKYLAEWIITRRAGTHSRYALDVMKEVSNGSHSLVHKEKSEGTHESTRSISKGSERHL